MNKFEKEVLKKHNSFKYNDMKYFTNESKEKVLSIGLPKRNCKINNFFYSSNDSIYYRCEYCLKNCGLKCLD